MSTGKVKWFNQSKGYGFITPDDNAKDVFLHISALQDAGINNIKDGQNVSYELVTEKGKKVASNIKII